MKKIININLSGRVIPIEDSAYEKLQAYIESLRRHFAKEEDRDEIINDIESRIAELMNEMIRKGAPSVTDADIDEIAASMGRPEELDAAESESTSFFAGTASSFSSSSQKKTESTGYTNTRSKNRLYRDTSDKMIGGVCAGLANYINIDPAIVRLLFAIITFGGFGFGVLIYILLWIVLPSRDLENYGVKRLYRNPGERVFGGVASGLAAYFNKEVWVIRLLFAAPLILNIFFGIVSWPFFHEGSFVPNIVFGSLTSTFILAYIVLWIVLPEAKSQYQQMEMRGEKVDVNSIRQNVKDSTADMKTRVKEWSEEVKESAEKISRRAKEFANTKGRTFAADANAAARRTGSGIGHMIAVIFKAFFLFIAGTIAFALFVGMMGLIFGGIGLWPLKNFLLDGFWQNAFAWGTFIFFLAVPLIAFIVWLLRRIMRVKSSRSYLGWTFGGLWTLGWICAALLAASLVNDFRISNNKRPGTNLQIAQPPTGRMIVQVSEPEIEYTGNIPWLDIDGKGADVTADTFKLSYVRVRVQKSEDTSYHVEVKKYSKGKTIAEAEKNAQDMQFHTSYADSILDIGSGIAIGRGSKYRLQKAIVTISVPVGKKIRFNETMDKLGGPSSIRIRFKNRNYERMDFDNNWDEYFNYDVNVDYVMTQDGNLVDPDKPVSKQKDNPDENNDNEENIKRDSVSTEIQQQILDVKREQEKRNRESDEKIRQLEKKGKEEKKGNTGPAAFSMPPEKNQTAVVINRSPVFALAETFF